MAKSTLDRLGPPLPALPRSRDRFAGACTLPALVASTNPDITPDEIRKRIRGSFPDDMGVEPLELTDELCRGRIVVDDRHLHPGRLVHGGVWVALADSVAAWQTFRHLPPGYDFTTIEMKLNVLAAGRPGDELVATAEHLHVGRTTHVVEVRVHRGDRVVANLIVTQLVLAPQGQE